MSNELLIYRIQTPKGDYIGKKSDDEYLEYHFKNACPDFIKQKNEKFFKSTALKRR